MVIVRDGDRELFYSLNVEVDRQSDVSVKFEDGTVLTTRCEDYGGVYVFKFLPAVIHDFYRSYKPTAIYVNGETRSVVYQYVTGVRYKRVYIPYYGDKPKSGIALVSYASMDKTIQAAIYDRGGYLETYAPVSNYYSTILQVVLDYGNKLKLGTIVINAEDLDPVYLTDFVETDQVQIIAIDLLEYDKVMQEGDMYGVPRLTNPNLDHPTWLAKVVSRETFQAIYGYETSAYKPLANAVLALDRGFLVDLYSGVTPAGVGSLVEKIYRALRSFTGKFASKIKAVELKPASTRFVYVASSVAARSMREVYNGLSKISTYAKSVIRLPGGKFGKLMVSIVATTAMLTSMGYFVDRARAFIEEQTRHHTCVSLTDAYKQCLAEGMPDCDKILESINKLCVKKESDALKVLEILPTLFVFFVFALTFKAVSELMK